MNTIRCHFWRNVCITALAPAIWGSTYLVTSEILPPDRPFTAAVIRTLPAGLLLFLMTCYIPAKRHWLRLLILSALNIGIFQALLFVAAYRLPGGLAAVLGSTQPLIIMGLLWAGDGKSPSQVNLWAALIGVVGMAILLLSPQAVFDPIGITAALAGAACMAAGTHFGRQWQIDIPILALTGWQLLIGGAILVPIACLFDAPLPTLTLLQISAYSYLSLIGALLTYILWFRGVALLPSVAVSSLNLLSPLTAVFLGWLVLGQSMTFTATIGLTLVLASVLSVQWLSIRSI